MFRANGGREPHVERSPPPSPSASVASFDVHGQPYSDWTPNPSRQRSESVSSSTNSHANGPLMGLGFGSSSQGGGGNTRDGVDSWRSHNNPPVLPSLGMQEDGSRIEVSTPFKLSCKSQAAEGSAEER